MPHQIVVIETIYTRSMALAKTHSRRTIGLMRFLLSIVMLLLVTLPVSAQDAGENQLLLKFAANNQAFDKNVNAQAKSLFLRQFPGCTAVTQIVRQLPDAYGTIVFPPATAKEKFPAPISGLWAEHVKIRACNKVYQVNLLATGQTDGTVVLLALLPGETRADPAIQRDAERIGAISITKADATCSDAPVASNTKFLSYRGADGNLSSTDVQQGWFEEWTYRFCQKDVPAQLAFLPNAEGGFDVKARPVGIATPQVPVSKPDNAAAE